MSQLVAERRKLYLVWIAHPKAGLLLRRKRKPGTIWNWHGATPWWANPRQVAIEEKP